MRRLSWIVWGAIALTLAGSLLALVQQTMVFFNVGADQAITGGLWQIVLSGSRFGDVWNARLFFLLILVLSQGAAHFFADRYPKSVRSFWTANVWVAALVVGAQAVNSHAAGSLVWPWVAVLVHWLHTLAVAFWLGGIAALMFLLPVALAPYKGATRWQALRPLMKRFSRYTVSAVLITITAGMYLAGNYLFAPADVATTYGAALGYKLVMVVLLLVVGALHHIALRPHLLQRVPESIQRVAEWARRFTGSIRLETLVALLAMGSAALLSATPTPEPAFLDNQVQTPVATQQAGAYTVQMSVIPGGPGVNTYDVVVRQRESDETVSGVDVQMQFAAPERGVRGTWHTAEAVDSGLYVTAGDDIDRGGRWWSLVDIFTDDGTLTRAAFEWNISDDAAVIQSVSPTPVNALTGFLLLLALGYALYPSLRVLVHRLDTSPLTLLVVGLSLLLSLALIPGSVWLLEQNALRVNQQLNPPPQQINPLLPDNDSVQQGEQLYNAHCLAWQTDSDFLVLLRGIGDMRDETLYDITANGWRDMPPCDDTLTESERWHVVNYARTLRTRAD
jgi:putative copper export protein